jgi:hypothetical protein
MLAPLAVFMFTMLIACTLTLLICWGYDAHIAETEAPRSLPVVLKFPAYSRRRRPHFRRPAPRLIELRQRRVEGRSCLRRFRRQTSGLIPS